MMTTEPLEKTIGHLTGHLTENDIAHIKEILGKYASGPMKSASDRIDPITLEWMREFSDRSIAILKRIDEVSKMLSELDSVKFAIGEEDVAKVNEAKEGIAHATASLESMKILEAAPIPMIVMNKLSTLDSIEPSKLGSHLIELGERIDKAYKSDLVAELPFWKRVSYKASQLFAKSAKSKT